LPALRFDERAVVVTGAGNGLGRSHAKLLAELGARVVVNDLGTTMRGEKADLPVAQEVVDEIRAAGGIAVANCDTVERGGRIIQCALDHFGRIDALVNNAGILRDRAFHQMSDEDWDAVYRVHVLGAYQCTKAAWSHFRRQQYGRVVFTVSGSGIYGNFGQANYAMAKLGTLGFAQTLAIEGQSKGILVNSVAPVAGSRLAADIWPKEVIEALKPRLVSHVVAYLCHEACQETGGIFEAGGGYLARLRWNRSAGVRFSINGNWSIDDVAASIDRVNDFSDSDYPNSIGAAFEPVLANMPADVAALWRKVTSQLWDSSRKED
jgi:(3R)-3-hydroxyacyl-CoA dehydrogenase / 3a,7a,12a-trihydroxy-5b-cholest-24-enoyl-CoA hydratase / enoyl-CoA hydratase 2